MKLLAAVLAAGLCSCVVRFLPNNDEVAIPVFPDSFRCETPCGLVSANLREPKDCEYLKDWESAYVTAFARTGKNLCAALAPKWKILLVDGENSAFVVNHKPVHGFTVCANRLIFLATKPYGFKSALPHELGHVLDCVDGVSPEDQNVHLNWEKKGYCEAIDASSTLKIPCDATGQH